MTPIVTTINEDFLLGARALRNSWLRHSEEGFSFHVIGYGDEAFERTLNDEFDNVIMNPDIGANLPLSYKCLTPNPPMYARILIPSLFAEYEKAIYIDADAVILKSLDGLLRHDMGNMPCAGTPSWSPISREVIGWDNNNQGIMSALIVFNVAAWNRKGMLDKCRVAMNEEKYHFKTVVQAVLQYVLGDDWYRLPQYAQVQGGHATTRNEIKNAYLLHFAGTSPWEPIPEALKPYPDYKIWARELWASYL